MARRKRKEDSTDWVAPEFDEAGYMRQEMRGTQAAVATIGWAAVGAIVAFALYSVLPVLAFFAGIAVGFGMYFVFPLIGIKTDAFKRKDWIGHGITYFFSWLAFWIILLNPPFGDFTDPSIQAISVSPVPVGYNGALTNLTCAAPVSGSVSLAMGNGNSSIYILFRASDNVGLARPPEVDVTPNQQSTFSVISTPVSGRNQCKDHRQETYLGGTYNATFSQNASSYTVTIIAVDPSGRKAIASFQILVTA